MFTDLFFSFTQWCSAIIFLATRFAIEMGFKTEDLHTNNSWWVISKEGIELVLFNNNIILLLKQITLADVAQFIQISIPHLLYISVEKRASSMSVKIWDKCWGTCLKILSF